MKIPPCLSGREERFSSPELGDLGPFIHWYFCINLQRDVDCIQISQGALLNPIRVTVRVRSFPFEKKGNLSMSQTEIPDALLQAAWLVRLEEDIEGTARGYYQKWDDPRYSCACSGGD